MAVAQETVLRATLDYRLPSNPRRQNMRERATSPSPCPSSEPRPSARARGATMHDAPERGSQSQSHSTREGKRCTGQRNSTLSGCRRRTAPAPALSHDRGHSATAARARDVLGRDPPGRNAVTGKVGRRGAPRPAPICAAEASSTPGRSRGERSCELGRGGAPLSPGWRCCRRRSRRRARCRLPRA